MTALRRMVLEFLASITALMAQDQTKLQECPPLFLYVQEVGDHVRDSAPFLPSWQTLRLLAQRGDILSDASYELAIAEHSAQRKLEAHVLRGVAALCRTLASMSRPEPAAHIILSAHRSMLTALEPTWKRAPWWKRFHTRQTERMSMLGDKVMGR